MKALFLSLFCIVSFSLYSSSIENNPLCGLSHRSSVVLNPLIKENQVYCIGIEEESPFLKELEENPLFCTLEEQKYYQKINIQSIVSIQKISELSSKNDSQIHGNISYSLINLLGKEGEEIDPLLKKLFQNRTIPFYLYSTHWVFDYRKDEQRPLIFQQEVERFLHSDLAKDESELQSCLHYCKKPEFLQINQQFFYEMENIFKNFVHEKKLTEEEFFDQIQATLNDCLVNPAYSLTMRTILRKTFENWNVLQRIAEYFRMEKSILDRLGKKLQEIIFFEAVSSAKKQHPQLDFLSPHLIIQAKLEIVSNNPKCPCVYVNRAFDFFDPEAKEQLLFTFTQKTINHLTPLLQIFLESKLESPLNLEQETDAHTLFYIERVNYKQTK